MSHAGVNSSITPTEVFQELLRRLQGEDWDGSVALHSAGLIEDIAERARVEASPPYRPPTVEELLAGDSSMPRDVAEREVARAVRGPRPSPYYGDVFGVETADQLSALSPRRLVAGLLHGRDYRWRWTQYIHDLCARHPEHRQELMRRLDHASSPWRYDVVGHVEDADRAYVVFGRGLRSLEPEVDDFPPRVAVMQRTSDGWKLSTSIVPGPVSAFGTVQVPDGDGDWISLY